MCLLTNYMCVCVGISIEVFILVLLLFFFLIMVLFLGGRNFLSDMCKFFVRYVYFANIFSQPVVHLFIFLVCFNGEEFSILIKSMLFL